MLSSSNLLENKLVPLSFQQDIGIISVHSDKCLALA